jgi:hypothetical protein
VPHLLSPRKGWENERLASYLLSRFSFVAQPSSIADDLGSDFFCTLFQIMKADSGHDVLRPLNSFAIQVKSSKDAISMDNKIDYLSRLELPFFVGVVDQVSSSMTVYSAELLPLLFSVFGIPDNLSFRLVDQPGIDPNHLFDDLRPTGGGIRLLCPIVSTFHAQDERSTLSAKVGTLHKICVRAHQNIAARASEEHIFEVDGKGTFQIVAGAGSAMHFRMNFAKRLGEVFKNLDWILHDGPMDELWAAEFNCFEVFYKALEKLPGWSPMPTFVSVPYFALRQKVGD